MSRTAKKQYSGSKKWDHTCRNHGSCSYCRENRLFFDRKARLKASKKEGLEALEN